ncbi:MAG: hypothetical protein AB7L91_19540 [Dehalococcoidia bacterium]
MSVMNLPEDALERIAESAVDADAASSDCACTIYAVVNSDGTLARGFRAQSSQRLATGQYEVRFNRNVRGCAYVASIGLSGAVGASSPGEVTVVGRFGDDRGVFVTTHNSGGAATDLGFHLAVHCRP